MTQLFIHGLGQGPNSWAEVLPYLPPNGQSICLDLKALIKGQEVTYQNLYKAFEGYCSRIPGTLHLCGLSLGAVLALNYAAFHGDKVESLVLIAPQYQMPGKLLKVQNILFRLMPQRAFKAMGFTKKEIISLTTSMIDLDLTADLPKVPPGALVLLGQEDRANKKAAKELLGKLHKAEFRVINKAGHEVNTQAPAELGQVLKDFYEKM